MVEQRAFGDAGGLDDVVQAAGLKTVGVELSECSFEQLAPRGLGCLDAACSPAHAAYSTDQSVWLSRATAPQPTMPSIIPCSRFS